MAPSRRKGVNKAAAAAIAREKWKVGDLVLAKVKGFPAWPATVSEPRKWGYTADQKKIVVEFFGCEQIAFCSRVDIEEFTEEKKGSLLGKRHGKGADFSRAVNEIVDCFEKLKKKELVSGANGTEETEIINENYSQESVVAAKKDEAPVAKVDPLSTRTTNDLDSLTEAAVAAAAGDAFENEDIQNSLRTEILASTPYLTRNRTVATQSRNSGSTKRKPARRLRSSSRIDSRIQSTTLPFVNNNRASRRFCASASEDDSIRRSRRIVKSSDESDGQDVNSRAFIANDFIEESNSGMMSVNSDSLNIDDGSTVDSVSKPVRAGEPATESNEGETDFSDRLDFQGNNVIKKKRKPNRKRHNTDTVDTAKPNIVASDIEELKTVLVSPSVSGKPAPKQAKDDGDKHLPLVKRARVRMGRPSPTVDEEFSSAHEEEQMSEVPERHSVQSFEPLSSKVDDHANNESVPIKEESSLSSLSHVSPANRPSFWEARKDCVDGEAALPPSKRLHRALEAMSANVAEDSKKTFNCSPATKIESNGYSTSFLECYGMSEGKKDMIELAYTCGAMSDQRNCDSLLSVPESCIVSDIGRSEIGVETTVVVSDCGKAKTTDSKNLELCTGSSEQAEGDDDTKDPNIFPFVEVPAEINPIVEDHLKRETENASDQLASFNCNVPSAVVSPANCCMPGCAELKEASKGSDPDCAGILVDFNPMQDITVGLPNIDTCNQPDDEGDEAHKTGDLASLEHNLDSKMSECVEEARTWSLDSKIMHPVTPVKVLNSVHDQSLVHSTPFSCEHTENRTLSVTQSSSSLTDGPESIARASPPSSAVCNISDLDNKKSLINNSSCCHDVHLHLEKAKLAGKSSSKSEALSSFEAIVKSLTRTKESIGRATWIAIDCGKFGFATKVMEILAHNLESESSLHKKVDLFFLVDSIAQCSRGLKGDGGMYSSAIQALLPRLLLAAAPPSCSSLENHRQCLKVLKVWQEILPESIIRHHIRELDALCRSYPTIGSNRTLRNERGFDDPVREMEGILVDEYGSNSSVQLPGFCIPRMIKDDGAGCDSDGESFEAVTPEHIVDNHEVEKNPNPGVEKRRHVLEDVDGELEMEDLAPFCENEIVSTSNFGGLNQAQMSHHLPKNIPLASAPVSRSPLPLPLPPPPHPLPPSGFPHAPSNSVSSSPHSKPYLTSQNYNGNFREHTNVVAVHRRVRENKDYEAEVPRYMPDNGCFSDRPTSRFSGRASVSDQPNDGFGKSFHLRPPHPTPSNQFSYVQEQRVQLRRNTPPPSRTNKFHSRNSNNGNFYRDRDRSKFVQRDHIGDGWRPQYPSTISGPCYPDGSSMANAPMSYGPPREPPGPNNRWNYPSWLTNHRHFNPYRPHPDGPIPVANRGPHYWRPR